MRTILLATVLTAACTPYSYDSDEVWNDDPVFSSDRLDWTGEIWAETDGMAYLTERDMVVGMSGMVCVAKTQGWIDADYDPVAGDETVTDIDDVDEIVVLTVDDDVHLTNPDGAVLQTRTVPGLVDARGDGAGDVVVRADDPELGCTISWHDERTRTSVPHPAIDCADDAQWTVDRQRGIAFVATVDGILAVDREGSRLLGIHGDRLAWDHAADVLYVADHEGVVVAGYEANGTLLWETELPAPVRHLRARGRRGEALVVTRSAPRSHDLWSIDGSTGEASHLGLVNANVRDAAVSRSGNGLAVQTGSTLLTLRER